MIIRSFSSRLLVPTARVLRVESRQWLANPTRLLSTSPILLAKRSKTSKKSTSASDTPASKRDAKKGSKNAPAVEDEDISVPMYDVKEYKQAADKIVEKFNEIVQQLRLGKADLNVLNRLKVQGYDNEKTQLDSVAQVTSRGGRQILITVYDPDMVTNIQRAILAANLNMNPVIDSTNRQNLLIPIPAPTAETRKETANAIKAAALKVRTGQNSSTAAIATLASAREDALVEIKKMKQASYSKDVVRSLETKIEALNKEYLTKIQKATDAAVKAVLSG
ncbi:ribosome recycling factor-domain-containing protein [Myxozyma melibiosi]|uniref:Ribosome-recycling factor, mitochondrial n=1 Tax=Myxozyma melibiosi TaxID=54550 RepID=A0ABR1F875_9ASCO